MWRIGIPVSALILALLAIPMSFVNPRAGRSVNLLFALLTYMVYYNLLSLSQARIAQGEARVLHRLVAGARGHAGRAARPVRPAHDAVPLAVAAPSAARSISRIPTLERYLARQIYAAVGFVLLGFLALFAFFDLIAELRDLGMGDYQLRQIFTAVALWMPGHAYELVPIAVLIGTLYVLAHLSSNSEFTVMRASGLSPARAGWMLAKVGLVFVVADVRHRRVDRAVQRAGGAAGAHARHPVADRRDLRIGAVVQGRTLVHQRARGARCGHCCSGVRIYEFDAAYRLRQVTEAERGEYAGDGNWRLMRVAQTMLRRRRADASRSSRRRSGARR